MLSKHDICAAHILSRIRLMGYLEVQANCLTPVIKSNRHSAVTEGCAVMGGFYRLAAQSLQYFLPLAGYEAGYQGQ